MTDKRAVIFANGVLPDPTAILPFLRKDDYWIAADGGSKHALECGRAPDMLIGDLDSISATIRESVLRAGTRIQPFLAEKDETDLELAIWFALREGFSAIRIVAGLGGRTDQILANLSLLSDPALAEFDIRIDDGREEVVRAGEETALVGSPGDTISLLPLGIPAEGVVTRGLQYPLRGETLFPYKTRGVSNRMQSTTATVSVERGVLLCIHTRSAT
jgi:thiamine pyrophosphokinase